jgi:hypothetical protein
MGWTEVSDSIKQGKLLGSLTGCAFAKIEPNGIPQNAIELIISSVDSFIFNRVKTGEDTTSPMLRFTMISTDAESVVLIDGYWKTQGDWVGQLDIQYRHQHGQQQMTIVESAEDEAHIEEAGDDEHEDPIGVPLTVAAEVNRLRKRGRPTKAEQMAQAAAANASFTEQTVPEFPPAS